MRRREFNQPGLAQFETKPSITLDVYAYLFSGSLDAVAAIFPGPSITQALSENASESV